MASSSGNSSSGWEGDLQSLVDQRKRKRMESNRESARRSRLRKQKHLDDLKGQVTQLQNENAEFLRSISLTARSYAQIQGENSLLRSQMAELTETLRYLNGILDSVNHHHAPSHLGRLCDGLYGAAHLGQHFPIMAAAEMMFDY